MQQKNILSEEDLNPKIKSNRRVSV